MSSTSPRPPQPPSGSVSSESHEHKRWPPSKRTLIAGAVVLAAIVGILIIGPLTSEKEKEPAHASGVCSNLLALAHNVDRKFGLVITSTTGGGHAANSLHYRGMAVDISGSPGNMYRAATYINASGLSRGLLEGIHNPNLSVARGSRVSPGYWGGVTWANHRNHLHLGGCSPILARGGRRARTDKLPLHVGSKGRNVRKVQRRLRRIKPLHARRRHVTVTGYYGRNTKRVVRTFQKNNHLPRTGIVGPKTWRAIARRAH